MLSILRKSGQKLLHGLHRIARRTAPCYAALMMRCTPLKVSRPFLPAYYRCNHESIDQLQACDIAQPCGSRTRAAHKKVEQTSEVLRTGLGPTARRIRQKPANGRTVPVAEPVVAYGDASRDRHGQRCALELQTSV